MQTKLFNEATDSSNYSGVHRSVWNESLEHLCDRINQPFILAVDDNEDSLLLAHYTAELCGIACIGRTSGWAALAFATACLPTLILLDILLPDLGGVDLFHYLKQDSLTRDIPIIAVTSLAKTSDRASLLAAGFADHISKPYMLEDLEAAIARHFKP
jgi:two-component system, cell cycle response regulator DivK